MIRGNWKRCEGRRLLNALSWLPPLAHTSKHAWDLSTATGSDLISLESIWLVVHVALSFSLVCVGRALCVGRRCDSCDMLSRCMSDRSRYARLSAVAVQTSSHGGVEATNARCKRVGRKDFRFAPWRQVLSRDNASCQSGGVRHAFGSSLTSTVHVLSLTSVASR